MTTSRCRVAAAAARSANTRHPYILDEHPATARDREHVRGRRPVDHSPRPPVTSRHERWRAEARLHEHSNDRQATARAVRRFAIIEEKAAITRRWV